MESILTYLRQAVAQQASDLFVVAGKAISMKKEGVIQPLEEQRAMPDDTEFLVRALDSLGGRPIDR